MPLFHSKRARSSLPVVSLWVVIKTAPPLENRLSRRQTESGFRCLGEIENQEEDQAASQQLLLASSKPPCAINTQTIAWGEKREEEEEAFNLQSETERDLCLPSAVVVVGQKQTLLISDGE